MKNNTQKINKLIVEIYNQSLYIEEKVLQQEPYEDLSITEFHTIEAIGENSQRTMTEVAKDLKITVGTLTTAINRLLKKGYVDRRRDEVDRRIVKVFLTEKGKSAHQTHQMFHQDLVKEMIKDLNDEEQAVIIQSLSQIRNFLVKNGLNIIEEKNKNHKKVMKNAKKSSKKV